MLVLSRKTEESIIIGDDIEITVVSVGSNRVRIGIKAPRSIAVRRSELPPSVVARDANCAASYQWESRRENSRSELAAK